MPNNPQANANSQDKRQQQSGQNPDHSNADRSPSSPADRSKSQRPSDAE